MDLEKLVEAVREYRCLWDVSKAAYKDRRKKENAWLEVATNIIFNCKHVANFSLRFGYFIICILPFIFL